MRVNRKEFLKLVGRGTAASVAAASVASRGAAAAQGQAPARQKKEVRGKAIKGTTDAVKSFIANA
jgi:hypothetical protein